MENNIENYKIVEFKKDEEQNQRYAISDANGTTDSGSADVSAYFRLMNDADRFAELSLSEQLKLCGEDPQKCLEMSFEAEFWRNVGESVLQEL